MKRESGEYCLSFSERRETRELAIYIYTHTSGNSQVFMQTASSVSRRCTNHVECTFFNLSSCLLSPLFLFLFQTSSRHLGKMCSLSPRAHHRLRLCTHGYVFATRPRIPVEDRHTDVSLSLFRSFFCSVTRDARTHVAFSTIGSIVAEQQSVIRFSQERLPRWTIARVSHRFHLECHSVFLSPSVLPKRQSECDRADKR